MPLDEQSQQLLLKIREANAPPLWLQSPAEAKAARVRAASAPAGPPVHATQSIDFRRTSGRTMELRVIVPTNAPRGVLIYAPGGGWCFGDNAQSEPLGRALALASDHIVVLVEYGKTPEHPYPAAVDDVDAVVASIGAILPVRHAELPTVVGGDSAGANLAAVAVRRARDRGQRLAAQVLAYPVTDADFSRSSYHEPENQTLLPRESMEWFWKHYLPQPERRLHPDASPLRAESLAGLPRSIVVTAAHDVLHDEGRDYAHRLAAEGVPVVYRRFDGQMHGFLSFLGILPAADRAIAFIARQLREAASSEPAKGPRRVISG